jgi:hypothetical protein
LKTIVIVTGHASRFRYPSKDCERYYSFRVSSATANRLRPARDERAREKNEREKKNNGRKKEKAVTSGRK